uniref:MOSC domain-containing protein n=1 Tax=Panagrolaimus davidi TaxID=227884 RepID=A0A914QIJ0_9BILA
MCSLFGIELRTGCFCNQGACNEYLGLKSESNNNNISTVKKCGDEMDLLNGIPLGACRISFGRTSTIKDFEVFKTMIETCFISTKKLLTKLNLNLNGLNEKKKNVGKLTDLFFYPIKSCSAAKPNRWKLTKSGLWLDRQWIIVSGDGIILTQKKLPALCNIIPNVTENNTLQLSDRNGFQNPIELPLNPETTKTEAKLTTVCISNYMAFSCGEKASKWLISLHPTFPQTSKILRLLPETCVDPLITDIKSSTQQNSTFTNEADYLLITWASVKAIASAVNLSAKDVAKRFRPNFIVETFTNIPFEEDNFSKIYIAGIPFEITGKCTRCQMISIDQESGEKDPKVLLALRDARCGDKITFGVYLKRLTENEADISVGSTVIIERNSQ